MTDDGPNYSRNIVRRRQLVSVAAGLGFVIVTSTLCGLLGWLTGDGVARRGGPDRLATLVTFAGAFGGGVIAGVLSGWATGRIHRSLCPEHPDEE